MWPEFVGSYQIIAWWIRIFCFLSCLCVSVCLFFWVLCSCVFLSFFGSCPCCPVSCFKVSVWMFLWFATFYFIFMSCNFVSLCALSLCCVCFHCFRRACVYPVSCSYKIIAYFCGENIQGWSLCDFATAFIVCDVWCVRVCVCVMCVIYLLFS